MREDQVYRTKIAPNAVVRQPTQHRVLLLCRNEMGLLCGARVSTVDITEEHVDHI